MPVMAQLADVQNMIVGTRTARGFTTDPAQLICLLTEEVGEVAAEIKKTWSPNYADLVTQDLSDELADTFVVLSALASRFEIDLEEAVRSKFLESDGNREWATAVDDRHGQ
jgi:NTP pyrophosphatase (non-canonical NTP hydrolase)